jgi:hypothetical protein
VAKDNLQITEWHPSVVHLRGKRLAETVQIPVLAHRMVFAGQSFAVELSGQSVCAFRFVLVRRNDFLLVHAGELARGANAVTAVQARTQCDAFQDSQEVSVRPSVFAGKINLSSLCLRRALSIDIRCSGTGIERIS